MKKRETNCHEAKIPDRTKPLHKERDMNSRPVPKWMRRGIRAVFNHEPVLFLRRGGGWFVEADALREVSFGEESVKQLAAAGIDLYVVHGYKGFGLELEKQEHDRLKRLRRYCTQHGVRLGTYCQVATICLETMQKDYPDSPNWIQKDAHGHPNFYNRQTYRNLPCYNNDDFKRYYKTVIKYLVEEIKTDLIHFDNLMDQKEPYACRCDRCRAAFSEHLTSKYKDEQTTVERFGFSDLRFIVPPVYHPEDDPASVPVVTDPVFHEWEEFRCLAVKRFIKEMSEYIVSLNPEVGVEVNSGSIPEMNRYRSCATYWPHLAPHVDIIYNESSGRMPRINPNGVLGTNIQGYKMGRTLGVGIWGGGNYESESDLEKTIAERLAFSPDYYFSPYAFDQYRDVYQRYARFYKDNQDFYHGKEQIRDIAVLRSVYTHRADSIESRLAVILAEQALIHSGMPFCIGFDDILENLDKVKVLFLPNVECLSREQCERICDYVKGGGGVVLTDETSRYDEWRRVRLEWGLSPLFNWEKESTGPVVPDIGSVYTGLKGGARKAGKRGFGEGRAVYLPTILPAEMPDIPRKLILQNYWTLPENNDEILGSILWACDGQISIRMEAPKYCCAEFTRDRATGKRVIHIVNLDPKTNAKHVRLHFGKEPPDGLTARRPGVKNDVALGPIDNDVSCFAVPAVKDYCLVFEPP